MQLKYEVNGKHAVLLKG